MNMSQGYQTTQQGNGLAVAALVLGIIGVLVSWIPCVGTILGILLAVLAIIFGFVGKSKANQGAPHGGLAIAGLAAGFLALIVSIGIPLVGLAIVGTAVHDQVQQQGGFEGMMKQAQEEGQRQMDDAARQAEEQQKSMELQIDDAKKATEPPAKDPGEPPKPQ
jgi:hypothetical protein